MKLSPHASSAWARTRTVVRAGVASTLIAAGLVIGAGPAAAAPSWSIVASPNPPGSAVGQVRAMTCTSAVNCFAVGQTQNWYTLIERWDGSNWNVIPSPDPVGPDGVNNDLSGVACATAASCFAVGMWEGGFTMIQHWDGTSWSTTNDTGFESGSLSAISCSGATSCQTVGNSGAHAIAKRWNGATWSNVTSPVPPGSTSNVLSAVRCTSANNCVAVGDYVAATTTKTLTERWNGTVWTILASPNPVGAKSSHLNGVACPLITTCFAVGGYDTATSTQTLIERWNGTAWSIVANPGGGATLSSVACYGISLCFAVGSNGQTFVERWNGAVWTVDTSPNPAAAQGNGLVAVSCVSTTRCFSVGNSDGRLLAEEWNGSWSLQPDPAHSTQSLLEGVSCPTSTSCFAVGSYRPPGPTSGRALVERWSGGIWWIAATPNPAGYSDSSLTDIDCVSVTLCYAVGAATVAGQVRTLVERWNGAGWAIVASPNPAGASSSSLSGIDCTSATRCIAVGTAGGAQQQTLAERWNGTAWTITGGAVVGELKGVSCASANDCLAVGNALASGDALVRHWNGSTWSSIAGLVPPPDIVDVFLTEATGVSCPAVNDCTVVGAFETDFGPVPLTAHWNGAVWSVPAVLGAGFSRAFDVSCRSGADCTAVGLSFGGPAEEVTLVLHWDGSTWSVVASPSAAERDSVLSGVSCTTAPNCVAVGNVISDAFQRTLVERLS